MAVLKLIQFTGEVPRLPGHLLPENAAQYALNCDFAHGELRGLRGNADVDLIGSINGEAVQSFYTEDGANFFGWPWETDVVKSLVVDDIYYRIFYTGLPGDGPVLKVARTYRNAAGALTRVIGNVDLVGGKYMPPEATNPGFGGNGKGPDSWLLGIPAPKVQNVADTDALTAGRGEKPSWPGAPKLQLRVTYFLEDTAGKIVYQQDVSNTEAAQVAGTSTTYPQVAWTNDTSQRGNKVQDMLWPLFGYQTPAPYKFYFMTPPDTTTLEIGRTVDIKNEGSGAITLSYTDTNIVFKPTTEQA